ncbi:MAG: SipW-dependent-type signal peptide-containing protein [Emergencia sp.]|nr:SipW-dependent-type signal peptide-containing protein [Emergencia sp.]
MKKKTLALVLALVLVGIIGGTIAWLTDSTEEVVNTFTDSNIEITLKETTGEEYKMVPGYTIGKDPKVTVEAGSEKCYLFVKLEKSDNFTDFLTYEMADGWIALDGVDNVYYRTVDTADKDTVYSVLKDDQVIVKGNVTKEMMNDLTKDNYPTLNVTAYASQYNKNATESFAVNEAWTNITTSSGN